MCIYAYRVHLSTKNTWISTLAEGKSIAESPTLWLQRNKYMYILHMGFGTYRRRTREHGHKLRQRVRTMRLSHQQVIHSPIQNPVSAAYIYLDEYKLQRLMCGYIPCACIYKYWSAWLCVCICCGWRTVKMMGGGSGSERKRSKIAFLSYNTTVTTLSTHWSPTPTQPFRKK